MKTVLSDRRRKPSQRHFLIGVLVAMAGCDGVNCVQLPCPLSLAISAVVVSSTGGELTGLYVDVGTPAARVPCDATTGRCFIVGNSGSYTLSFGASGYRTLQRNVTVSAVRATQECGCATVTTQQLQLTLVPL